MSVPVQVTGQLAVARRRAEVKVAAGAEPSTVLVCVLVSIGVLTSKVIVALAEIAVPWATVSAVPAQVVDVALAAARAVLRREEARRRRAVDLARQRVDRLQRPRDRPRGLVERAVDAHDVAVGLRDVLVVASCSPAGTISSNAAPAEAAQRDGVDVDRRRRAS